MLLYRLKWTGLLGYKGRDQMLLESKRNLPTGFGFKLFELMIRLLLNFYEKTITP